MPFRASRFLGGGASSHLQRRAPDSHLMLGSYSPAGEKWWRRQEEPRPDGGAAAPGATAAALTTRADERTLSWILQAKKPGRRMKILFRGNLPRRAALLVS